MADDPLLALAEITRPHGLRGEVRVRLYNPTSTVLQQVSAVVVEYPDGERAAVQVCSARRAPDGILLALEGSTSREDAEELRGCKLLVPRDMLPELTNDEAYAFELEGASVVAPDGPVGTVLRMESYPSCDALVVQLLSPDGASPKEIEIPMVEGIIEQIDKAARVIRVSSRDVLEPQ